MSPAGSASVSTVTLAIRPDPSHVRLVRLVAVALGRLNGIGEDVLDDIRLATGEACGRAVAAHMHYGLTQPVEVELRCGSGLDIDVHDFVPLERASGKSAVDVLREDTLDQAATDTAADAGLPEAIGLIEGISDKVTVNTGKAGTTVSMWWAGT